MSTPYKVFVPTITGRGCAALVGEEAKALGCKKVLLVHGPVLPKATVERIKKNILDAGIEVVQFGKVVPDVPDYIVTEGVEFVRSAGGVDGIVALGGGSTIDTAKCINMMLNNPAPIQQYFAINGGVPKNPGYPLISIPTTSGTGSEQTRAFVCLNTEEDVKRPGHSDICCLSKLTLVDPEVCITMPRELTAMTGYDAFSHAYETYTTEDSRTGAISDALALVAMESLIKYLPMSLSDLDNLDYREKVADASTIAGMATANSGSHLGHGIGHAMGSCTHAPHGASVAAGLPFVADFITSAVYYKNKTVVELFGIEVPDGTSAEDLGAMLRKALQDFERDLGCPTIKDFGATREKAMKAYDLVTKDPLFRRGKKLMNNEELRSTLENICDYYGLE